MRAAETSMPKEYRMAKNQDPFRFGLHSTSHSVGSPYVGFVSSAATMPLGNQACEFLSRAIADYRRGKNLKITLLRIHW